MFDEMLLWKKRFGEFTKETGRYLRYIFNGHLVIVFLFLLGTGAYYYQEWVATLDSDFPVAIIMAAVIAFFLTYSPIYTFLQEADKIFLLPLEKRMTGYFQRSLFVSLGFQTYILLITLAVFMPMYVQVTGGAFKDFFVFLGLLVLVKGFNLVVRWKVQYYIETNVHRVDALVRYCVNAVFLFLLFSGASLLLVLIVVAIMALLYFYYRNQTEQKGLKWEQLIEAEERRMTTFYRIANLFTDVPKLKDRVKRRRWLDWLTSWIPYGQSKTFTHLYLRTFLRAGDYFGLFVRLTLIGVVALYVLSYGIGQVLIAVLFLYLTGFQLLPLWNHHQYKLLVQLYPVKKSLKRQSFNNLMLIILLLQTSLFSLTILVKGDELVSLFTLVTGAVFTWFFTYLYNNNRLQKL